MSLTNCPECGKEISDKAFSCPGCGYPPNENITNNFHLKKKTPGKGFGIAGMILGILGAVYSPLSLATRINVSVDALPKSNSTFMGIYLAIWGILALVFGFIARKRGYKKGQSTAAIVTGFITLAFCIAIIISTILI